MIMIVVSISVRSHEVVVRDSVHHEYKSHKVIFHDCDLHECKLARVDLSVFHDCDLCDRKLS